MEAFNQLILEYPQFMYGGAGATVFMAGGALIYKIATRKKPTHVNVNCWFCNQDSVVPYGNRNCWDCPNCEQYNGFQENGDYNKPIPAQFSEHLNHGVSAGVPLPETPKTLQWVNCQMLLCKKCNNNQSVKIKQLASFIPREDENYDEEIEVYKHHVEQTYKLCRPCQTAVEYYIKHQNRQLRAVLFSHQLRRSRDCDKAFVKSSYSFGTPVGVILLRVMAFLTCAFLVATALYGSGDQTASAGAPQTLSGGIIPPKPAPSNKSTPKNGSSEAGQVFQDLLELLPEEAVENAKLVWQYGRNHQMAVVSIGLLTCITGVCLGGPVRLRRIDAVASVLWFLVLCLYLVERYLKADVSSWLDTVKLGTTSLCCLVGFAAAVATRKSMGPRRARGRRYLSGSSVDARYGTQAPLLSPISPGSSSTFIPTPPPNLSQLINRQKSPRERKASPSSLPGRLNRALYLGTIPSLARTDSGYLFSGSRPPSQCKDSPPSDYFSLKSGSRPSSPCPSPTPSVAGSVTSSSSSRHRRPLISPARLNISGQKLRLFSSDTEHQPPPTPTPPHHFSAEPAPFHSGSFHLPDVSPYHSSNDLSSLLKEGSVISEEREKRRGSSSGSSACMVDTTTGAMDSTPGWKGLLGRSLWPGILLASLSANLFFTSLYLYRNW
ncbi:transmembrane protein 201 isoform X1 [Salmo salar]|uniref:Transmembrane protein 201 isoform X1 n=1 Tax=Salmo salar TaxID=8030 RepID=A0A1S3ME95_SALSA|nr:transmembrane protein 201 isoform X1 [Salmo salar]|eukprot:XP_014001251.1 PREDICTED: transmembrane protein 201 isoform X2 [Salmo salar]